MIYLFYLYLEKKMKILLVNLPLFKLIRYTNNNYIDNSKNKKLTINYYLFFSRAIIFKCSKNNTLFLT